MRDTLQRELRLAYLTIIVGMMLVILTVAVATRTPAQSKTVVTVKWQEILRQKAEWYASTEAVRIADNVVLFQRATGGWPKNIDMATLLSDADRQRLSREKSEIDSTIDNGATYTQMIFLSRVFKASHEVRFRNSFIKGFDYLLEAQYANGGWPQYYPIRPGYYQHITFNDDAMIGVMQVLRDVAQKKTDYDFIDPERRERAAKAVAKGIECILKTQVIVHGSRTVWCAQHDEVTLAPAPARTYELISLSGQESVGVVRFLMGIENPEPRVVDAIKAAISWFKSAELQGIRWVQKPDATKLHGFDRVVVTDNEAPPLWARFYDIETNRPIFSGRDGVVKYSVSEIEDERRNGYRWYTDAPEKLLTIDYAAWLKRVSARNHG